MRRKDVKKWLAGCGLIFFFSLFASGTAMAEWRNIDKGPGGAEWVDENGNVIPYSEYKKEKEEMTVLEENVEQESQEAVQETETAVQETEAVLETSERVIDPSRPMVALTFDDGPYAPVGNRIMDCLAQYGGKATFFVVGNRCASYAEEMQRMVAEGHEIGNHTYSHKYLDKLGASEIQSQIQRGNEAIQAVAGVPAVIVRLPGGNKNATVLANVNAPMIMWSIDTLDWKLKNAQTTIDAVLGKVRDGDIVLMHELYSSTGDAAMQIIPALVERGYQLVTVSELAQYRGGLESGKLYFNFYQ